MKAQRYDAMIAEAAERRPKRIMEIGTCKGERAERLIRAAGEGVEYFGFDLFDHPPDYELTPRALPNPMPKVQKRLDATGAAVRLFRGDTRETLIGIADRLPAMDLIFIDGGHSAETIASDWRNVRALVGLQTVVFFDDYWNYKEGGCNAVIAELQSDPGFRVEVLEPADEFPRPYGVLRTQLVRVTQT